MRVTIKQIAEQAGVSRGTVDRVLNHRGKVRPEVEQRVQRIADELGYRPNLLGRALGMTKNNIKIGIIVQAADTAFMKAALEGVKNASREVESYGGSVVLKKISGISAEQVLQAVGELQREEVNAIAMMPVEDDRVREKMNQVIEESQIPVITFNADIEGTKRLCYVGQDAVKCGQTAAALMGEIFRGRGGTIAIISGFESNTSLSGRVQGFRGVIKESFPEIHLLDTVYCEEHEETARQQMEKILENYPELSGVYMTCYGESGVCEALKDYHKDQKIVMIASDMMGRNYELLEDGVINLLIGQQAQEQGYEAIMVLYRLLFNGESPTEEYHYMDILIKNRYNI